MATTVRAARRCVALATRSSLTMGTSVLRVPVRRTAPSALADSLAFGRYGVAHSLSFVRCFASDASTKLGPMNNDIRGRVVNIVGDDGVMRRDVPIAQALQEARAAGVDLVQVASNSGQPVCRLFNAQKRLFSLKKSMKQSKPKQDKEVTLGVKTETHDIQTKAAQLRGFLAKGHKVKVTVKFGREFHLLDRAIEQLKVIEETVGIEVGVPDHKPQNQYGGVYVHFVPKSSSASSTK